MVRIMSVTRKFLLFTIIICLFFVACRHKDSSETEVVGNVQTSESNDKDSLLYNYVAKPIKKTRNLSNRLEKRQNKIDQALEDN